MWVQIFIGCVDMNFIKNHKLIFILFCIIVLMYFTFAIVTNTNYKKLTVVENTKVTELIARDNNSLVPKNIQPDNSSVTKIAIITSPTSIDDSGFNEACYYGIETFLYENSNYSITPVRETFGDSKNAIIALETISDDFDIIVCCGFQFANLAEIATKHADTKYLLIDSAACDKNGNPTPLDNVYAMTFAEQEGGFLAGAVAALETKTGKVAALLGMPFPSNVNYQYGFYAGINYINTHYNKKVKYIELPIYGGTDIFGNYVGGNYIGSFSDESKAKSIVQELINRKADIVFVAAGTAGKGAYTIAKNSDDVYIIGCDSNQFDLGQTTTRNCVLTSVIKNMSEHIYLQLNKIKEHTFSGENKVLYASNNGINYIYDEQNSQLKPLTKNILELLLNKIINKEIIPPSNFNNSTPNDFFGLKEK